MNIYNNILNRFTSNDHLREWMQTPFLINDMAYATDAHTLIVLPKKLTSGFTELESDKKEMVLNISNLDVNHDFKINAEELKSKLSEVPMVDEYEETDSEGNCNECDGDGEVEWSYDHFNRYLDCPYCDGEGVIEKTSRTKTGGKTYDDNCFIKVISSVFKPIYLSKLLNVAEALNVQEITLINYTQPNRAALFKVGDCKVLLMPILPSNEYKTIHQFI